MARPPPAGIWPPSERHLALPSPAAPRLTLASKTGLRALRHQDGNLRFADARLKKLQSPSPVFATARLRLIRPANPGIASTLRHPRLPAVRTPQADPPPAPHWPNVAPATP